MNEAKKRYENFGAAVAGVLDGYCATEEKNSDRTLRLILAIAVTHGIEIAGSNSPDLAGFFKEITK